MEKTIADYTEAAFTDWVKAIIDYSRCDDHTWLYEALKEYQRVVGKAASDDFIWFIETVASDSHHRSKYGDEEEAKLFTLLKAEAIVNEVKAWYRENKLPCFCDPGLATCPGQLSRQALIDLVLAMAGDNPTQEVINAYHRAVVRFGAPDFIAELARIPAKKVINHIYGWHNLYRTGTTKTMNPKQPDLF